MSRTLASAVASGRPRGDLVVLAAVSAVFLVAAALHLLRIQPNHDSVWLLVAAERMLDGGTYERDFFEINPPLAILLHAPSFLIRSVSGLDSYSAYIILTLVYIGASLALLRKIVAEGFPPASDFQLWLPPVAAVLFLLLPGYDFGQREHLFSIFVIPYLALHSANSSHGISSRRLMVLVSAWASLGLFLKPMFLLLPILISLDRAIRRRSLRSLISVDMITIGVMGLIYTAVVLIRFPDYFTVARYALEFYGVYDEDLFLVAVVPVLYALVGVVLALIAARIAESPEEDRMFALLALAAAVATGSAILQQKGWSYHILPVEIFVGMSVLMIVVIASGQIRRRATSRAFVLVARAAPLLIVVLPLQSSSWDLEDLNRQDLIETELYSELEPVAAGKPLYVFSSSVIVGTRWVATINASWSSRYSCLWLLPGYVTAFDNGTLPAVWRNRLAGDIRRAVEEDFERYRPEVVLVDRREYKHGFMRPFDFLDFFLAGERFAMIWKSYSFYKTVDGLDIYLLSDRAGAAAAPGVSRSTQPHPVVS